MDDQQNLNKNNNIEIKIDPIEKLVLIDQIIEKIEKLIENGSLKPGDALPSERTLAEMSGVSRTSIREALKALSVLGVLKISPGRKTYINKSMSELLINPFRFMKTIHNIKMNEFIDARRVIETELVKRAAEKSTNKDINNIKLFLDESKKAIKNRGKSVVSEFAFHHSIFEVSDNRILKSIMNSLYFNQALYGLGKRKNDPLTYKDRLNSYNQHCKIFRAIKEKKPIKAKKAMIEHLDSIERLFKEAGNN